MRDRRSEGFTLIELLVTVAIIGLLIAISVINYRNAIDRGRQRRTMADMRSIASGVEAYAADFDRYPPASAFTMPSAISLPTENLVATTPYLQPTYLIYVPLVDGWNSWFCYDSAPSDYALRSGGLGGELDAPVFRATTSFRDDIIYVNGQFVQYPDGQQR